ncbi:MAG: hypothetical protein ACRC8J_00680, partial [Phocaeicola sp.]
MKKQLFLFSLALTALLGSGCGEQSKQQSIQTEEMIENKEHYTFELSDKVTRTKVSFKNRYGITLVGDLYMPKNATEKTEKL